MLDAVIWRLMKADAPRHTDPRDDSLQLGSIAGVNGRGPLPQAVYILIAASRQIRAQL